MGRLKYCKKCGWICLANECEVCDLDTFEIPEELLDENRMFFKSRQLRQEFIETCIKTAPEFDKYYFEHRDEINRKKNGEHLEICFTDGGKTAYIKGSDKDPAVQKAAALAGASRVSCPYCGSSSVKKIGVMSRALSFKMFGVASGKIGKQWHCNVCGTNF